MDGTLGPEPWTVDGESLDAKTQGVAGRETSHNEKRETTVGVDLVLFRRGSSFLGLPAHRSTRASCLLPEPEKDDVHHNADGQTAQYGPEQRRHLAQRIDTNPPTP